MDGAWWVDAEFNDGQYKPPCLTFNIFGFINPQHTHTHDQVL